MQDPAKRAGDWVAAGLVDDFLGELDGILDGAAGLDVGVARGESRVAVLIEDNAIAAQSGRHHEARVEESALGCRRSGVDGPSDKAAGDTRVDKRVVIGFAVPPDREIIGAFAHKISIEIAGYHVSPAEHVVRGIFRERGVADRDAVGIDENLHPRIAESAQLSMLGHAGRLMFSPRPEMERPDQGTARDVVTRLSAIDHPATFQIARACGGVGDAGSATVRVGNYRVWIPREQHGIVDRSFHPLLRAFAIRGDFEREGRGDPGLAAREYAVKIRIAAGARTVRAAATGQLRRGLPSIDPRGRRPED